ncbi:uncharacterized protein FTOL_07932 [Fusarium torulosum]|uniref:Tat pathway signal sequence n=1 Tax=Fusarium torulosum TaxID=33205 RepID=A0AAE8MBL3_9HYPO|nr:uncharacterized protein FTOL_07932 [Fusarium torulosum]
MIRGHNPRTGSFNSISRPYLPSIDENEIASTPSSPGPPTPPLRIPRKSPHRALRNNGLPPAYIPRPRVYYAPPVAHYSPPSYAYAETKGKFIEHESAYEGSYRERRFCGIDKRRGYCLLVIALVGLAVVAIALGIGLSIGLNDDNQRPAQESSTPEPTPQFPAGSFAFRADLQNTSTECTSNPSTWRCYPYKKGSSATFFWIITPNGDDSYNISSTENPFAPSFANLTLKMLDKDTSKERLQFSFSMDKTVVPDDDLSASNRVAKCTFDDTLLEATLWTQGGDGSDSSKFADWPGNVEIVQRKTFDGGSPTCVDSEGGNVGDVTSAAGSCECRYANYDTN